MNDEATKTQLVDGHPNVLTLVTSFRFERSTAPHHHVGLVLELADEDLPTFAARVRLDERAWAAVFEQVAAGLEHIHARRVVDGDIKPTNVLRIGARFAVADFGVAAPLESTRSAGIGLARTIAFWPPESATQGVLQADGVRRPPVEGWRASQLGDVWALAVSSHRMLTGRHITAGTTPEQQYELVCLGRYAIDRRLGAGWQRLLEDCLAQDPRQRRVTTPASSGSGWRSWRCRRRTRARRGRPARRGWPRWSTSTRRPAGRCWRCRWTGPAAGSRASWCRWTVSCRPPSGTSPRTSCPPSPAAPRPHHRLTTAPSLRTGPAIPPPRTSWPWPSWSGPGSSPPRSPPSATASPPSGSRSPPTATGCAASTTAPAPGRLEREAACGRRRWPRRADGDPRPGPARADPRRRRGRREPTKAYEPPAAPLAPQARPSTSDKPWTPSTSDPKPSAVAAAGGKLARRLGRMLRRLVMLVVVLGILAVLALVGISALFNTTPDKVMNRVVVILDQVHSAGS